MSNEITVRLICSMNEMCSILENKGFKIVDKYSLDDTYYISKELDETKLSPREVLNHYILVRKITQYRGLNFKDSYNIIKITYKNKNFSSDGEILSQDKVDCEITEIEDGKKFLKALGYKAIMDIKENSIVYGKDEIKIAIKDVENDDNLIEIETIENNDKYDTTEKLKLMIRELNIPIDESDFFVKKAENKLKKILGVR